MDFGTNLIAIVTITIPFIFVIAIVLIGTNASRQRNRLQADLYIKALEKGQTVPSDLFAQPKKKQNPLNTGILCIVVGIGVALFLFVAADGEDKIKAASVGIVPVFVGIAYLIIHFIGKKQNTDGNAQ